MKVVIENRESCYLNLLGAIEEEIRLIRKYRRLKIIKAKVSEYMEREELR